jgi:hypothetical protein
VTAATVVAAGGTARPYAPARGQRRGSLAGDGNRILVTRVGLSLPTTLTYDGWQRAGQQLFNVIDSSAWCLGDWIIYGEARYADRYRCAVEAAGLDYKTIRNYAWVARRFELSRRRSQLSFQHHAEVAALDRDQQDLWLTRAERLGWSRNELRRQVRGGPAADAARATSLPRLAVEPERLERWRSAAECSDSDLESWILAQLDVAASLALGGKGLARVPALPAAAPAGGAARG